MTSNFITKQEAASQLNVSLKHIEHLLAKGDLYCDYEQPDMVIVDIFEAYKEYRQLLSKEALGQMVQLSQELGLY